MQRRKFLRVEEASFISRDETEAILKVTGMRRGALTEESSI